MQSQKRPLSSPGPFERMVEAAASKSIVDFLPGFFKRHPKLVKFRDVDMVDGGDGTARGTHPEAEVLPRKIVFYDKFWAQKDQKLRDWMVAHELGHWALHATVGLSGIMDRVDLFNDLPFGQDSGEEAFAECFASYFLDGDVQKKFPAWASTVEFVYGKA